ncbi:hypothetical protein [Priestia aryabhattai]
MITELNRMIQKLGEENDVNPLNVIEMLSLVSEMGLDINLMNNISKPSHADYMKSLILLAIALGSDERCREDIEKEYQEEKHFYYYNWSRMGEIKLFDKFTVTTSEYIKKCYAIILFEELEKKSKDIPILINRMIKKAYKHVLNFNMQKKWMMIDEFTAYYEKKIEQEEKKTGRKEKTDKSEGLYKISGKYLDRCFYVLMYLAYKKQKTLFPTETLETIENHFQSLVVNYDLEDILEVEAEYTDGYEKLLDKMTFKDQSSKDVSYFFENIRLLEENELIEKDTGSFNVGYIRGRLVKMPLNKIINSLTMIIKTFGLSEDFLYETKLGNKQLEQIAKFSYAIKNRNALSERETEIIFLVALAIYAISSEYNKLREGYYEGLKMKMQEQGEEEKRREEALKEGYQKEIAELQEKLRLANVEKSALKEVCKKKEDENSRLRKGNKRLEIELDKTKDYDKELLFLRDFYFDSQVEEQLTEEEGDDFDTFVEYLKPLKIAIVGGHPNLTKKIKEVLPNFDYIAEKEKNRKVDFLANKDIVFISSVHDNHSMYEKVVAVTKNSKTVLWYLKNRHQNLYLLFKDMYKECRERLN